MRTSAGLAIRHGDHRMVQSVRIGEKRHHRAQIFDAARHGTDLPQRFDPPARGRNVAGARQASRGRLDARDAAEVRGQADAAGRVATQPEGRSARRDQRGLAPAGPAGGARKVVRIVGAAVNQVVAFEGEQEVGQIRSGDRNRAGGSQTRHEGGVPRRSGGRFASRAFRRCRPFPATSIESLMENGTPAERTERMPWARCRSTLSAVCRADFASTSTTAFRHWIHLFDALEVRVHELGRRYLAVPDQARLRGSGQLQDVDHFCLIIAA